MSKVEVLRHFIQFYYRGRNLKKDAWNIYKQDLKDIGSTDSFGNSFLYIYTSSVLWHLPLFAMKANIMGI